MSRPKRHPLISGARVTGLGTLASRVLGLVRDMATASLFGLAGGGVMDALVIALRIPNTFRRLFGEGALTAAYLPVITAELERDRKSAWQLTSVTLTWLAILLAALVLLGEMLLSVVWWLWRDAPDVQLLVGLTATLLPYLLLICLTAQLAATLHAISHFTLPALTPVVLNVCWLIAIWAVAPRFEPNRQAQAYVVAIAVLIAGVLQIGVQWPMLRRFGFRFDYNWAASRDKVWKIVRTMAPMIAGLAVTQVNVLLDSLIAWGLAAPAGCEAPPPIEWLGGVLNYPLKQGAAAAIYYGERLYHFPLGVVGLAVATAIFPLLSRHAARGDRDRLGHDLTLGLRMVLYLTIPAGAGLALLAEPLSRLLFERGNFRPEDTIRTARMITCYAAGVWAFCALPVVIRGFYALGDNKTPAKTAAWIVGLNLTLNLLLIWTPLAAAGLALATSISAMAQVLLLALIFSRQQSAIQWPMLMATAGRTAVATGVMAAVGYTILGLLPPGEDLGKQLLQVFLPLVACTIVYFAAHRLFGGRESAFLLRGLPEETDAD